jgi:hypothetical protein
MKSHGGTPLPVSPDGTCRFKHAKDSGSGAFRHFLRPPNGSEIHRLHGTLPRDDFRRADDLLTRLSHHFLFSDRIWDAYQGEAAEAWENPDIPAGYTYLLQLVAHDLVQASVIFPRMDRRIGELRNHRTFSLDLDTLYGSGPAACPHAYSASTKFGFRSRLKLSRMRQSNKLVPAAKPAFRDIGRGYAHEDNSFPRNGPTEALLADPRNDDNANISQLLTVFIWLHNTVIESLEAQGAVPPEYSQEVAEEYRFGQARRIVTETYRRIVRHDLLPRILHPDVLRHYETDKSPYLETDADERMPMEFSHAAFRFGHAMIRPSYRLNTGHPGFSIGDILRTNSLREPYSMPLNEKWIVEWSRFFELDDPSLVNLSRRIGPSLSSGLEVPDGFGFPLRGTTETLAHRDLLRGASADLWSVPALIAEIGKRQPDLIAMSPLLSDITGLRARLQAWLATNWSRSGQALSELQIDTIAEDPPLFFFILFEAMAEAHGRHLGVLGSTIVAEILLRRLDSIAPETGTASYPATGFETVRTMPALLRTLAERSGLSTASPSFL